MLDGSHSSRSHFLKSTYVISAAVDNVGVACYFVLRVFVSIVVLTTTYMCLNISTCVSYSVCFLLAVRSCLG